PALIAAYGVSLVGAGIFRADPAQGFPVGTPETTPISWHGTLHFVVGGVGFICLIVACFVLAGRFRREARRALASFSLITGVAFLAAVGLVWAWLAAVCIHFYRTLADTGA